MKLVQVSLALSLVLAGCATTDQLSRQAAVGGDSVESHRVAALRDGERVSRGAGQPQNVCKAVSVTGTRNTRRVCHTREEWIAMRRNGEETVRTIHREGTKQGNGAMSWVSNGDKSGAGG